MKSVYLSLILFFYGCYGDNKKTQNEKHFSHYFSESADAFIKEQIKECDENKIANSCMAVGEYYNLGLEGIKQDKNQAFVYFKKACDLGNKFACENLKYQ